MASRILRPKKRPAQGFTDAEGFKTANAPAGWPFGMSSAPPVIPRIIRPKRDPLARLGDALL